MKRNKGITLISLIITIIVIVIISGVALSTLTRQNNIVNNADTTVGLYKNKVEEENNALDILNSMLSNPIGDQDTEVSKEPEIQLSASTVEKTEEDVIVTIKWINIGSGYTKEYKKGDGDWITATEDTTTVTVEENCTVKAKVTKDDTVVASNNITISCIEKKEPATASEYFSWTTTSTSATITGFSDAGKTKYNAGELTTLVFPEEYNGVPVTRIECNAFENYNKLTEIKIPETIKSLGYYAFGSCKGLTEIVIPKSITGIGYYNYKGPFYNCTNISKITFEDGMTKIPGFIFSYAYLKSNVEIIIPSSVTEIGEKAFYYCTGITKLNIPSSVTTLNELAFANCTGITELVIPNTMTTAKNIYISDGLYGGPFYNCTNVDKVIFEEGMTKIPENILRWATLKTDVQIVIPNTVKEIGNNAFYKCSGIKEINIPSSITTIGQSAFTSCIGLTEINIPSSITTIGQNAFTNCIGLTEINIPESVTSIGIYAFSWCSGLTEVNTPAQITSIPEGMFYQCTGLTTLNIANTVTTIESNAFSYCTSLTKLNIPSSVTKLNGLAFANCTGLTELIIPKTITTATWTYVSDGYYGGPFYNCTNVDKVIFEDGMTKIPDNILRWATLKTDVQIVIPNTVKTIGHYAFYRCSGIKELDIPSSITTIEYNAFTSCKGLTKLNIPESVTSIGTYAFSWCSGLTEVNISAQITSIQEGTFYQCTGLTSITIPSLVTAIGDSTFDGCSSLSSATFRGTKEQWGNITIGTNNTPLNNATITYEQ